MEIYNRCDAELELRVFTISVYMVGFPPCCITRVINWRKSMLYLSSIEPEFRGVLPAPGERPLRLRALPLPLARPPRPKSRVGLGALAAVPPAARVPLGRHDVPLVRRIQVRDMVDTMWPEIN